MTSEQHNRNVIKEIFKDYNLSDEIIEKIRLFGSERYIDGLKQKEFDITMDIVIERQVIMSIFNLLRENGVEILQHNGLLSILKDKKNIGNIRQYGTNFTIKEILSDETR